MLFVFISQISQIYSSLFSLTSPRVRQQALAASSALGLRFALEAAVPRLVKARSDATSALRAMESALEVNGAKAGAARTAAGAADDAQAARLAALAGLAAAVDREVRRHPERIIAV